jgi:SH3-like domain-containing protein
MGVVTYCATDYWPHNTVLYVTEKTDSRTVAFLRADALASLDRCKDGWCKIKVERVSGWTPARSVWGATETAQCR